MTHGLYGSLAEDLWRKEAENKLQDWRFADTTATQKRYIHPVPEAISSRLFTVSTGQVDSPHCP